MTPASKQRVLLAFGGNASYPPNIKGLAEEQFALIEQACEHIARMVEAGYKLIITHGNGPVVGNILFRMARTSKELAPMPMDVCVAHSQGGMGYMMQQTLANVLHRRHIDATVSSIITQVEVDAQDPGFAHATKPVGRFLTREDADRLARETGWEFAEDSGRGYRRVVPSPKPRAIIDVPSIEALLHRDIIPIAAGGGGIPVVRDASGELHGVPAVIDKDLTSAMLASAVGARHLIMLTGVDRVAIDFGKPTQRALDKMSVKDAQRHMADGQFPAGSMGPKIAAALNFLSRSDGRVVITSIQQAFDALQGTAGTHIVR
jgi:carbamate kinase